MEIRLSNDVLARALTATSFVRHESHLDMASECECHAPEQREGCTVLSPSVLQAAYITLIDFGQLGQLVLG
jgi:hypothetical protein